VSRAASPARAGGGAAGVADLRERLGRLEGRLDGRLAAAEAGIAEVKRLLEAHDAREMASLQELRRQVAGLHDWMVAEQSRQQVAERGARRWRVAIGLLIAAAAALAAWLR
jgi:hypothetical protein